MQNNYTWQALSMNNICRNVYVYLYHSKFEPDHFYIYFLLCSIFFKIKKSFV